MNVVLHLRSPVTAGAVVVEKLGVCPTRQGRDELRLVAAVFEKVLEEPVAPVAPLVSSATRPKIEDTHACLQSRGA